MHRDIRDMTCYELACAYVDLKRPRAAATTRKTHAEALTAVIPQLFARKKGKPDDRLIRTALRRWAFNTPARGDEEAMPAEVRSALSWIARNARSASDLLDPEVLRPALDGLTLKLDGKPGSPVVVSRRRKIFTATLEHGVEIKALPRNPWTELKWTPPRSSSGGVDRRRVVNPMQARTLLVAGQSAEVLWRDYAKCLDGETAELRRRMRAGYGDRKAPENFGTDSRRRPSMASDSRTGV
jgi:hypothetical protein